MSAPFDCVQRVRDLEVWVLSICQTQTKQAAVVLELAAENARLRRAVRVLARLQPARVSRAVMEVLDDAR